MKDIYFIGGSPCSGKSTIAEAVAEQFDLTYFKVDDFLDAYLQRGIVDGKKMCTTLGTMTPEELWMREPVEQAIGERKYYEEIFEYILEDIEKLPTSKTILTEGAAFLPQLMKQISISPERYLAITPTKAFQLHHYQKREWAPLVVKDTSSPKEAFNRWMERDALFGEEVRKQCKKLSYRSLVTDGQGSIADRLEEVIKHFGLNESDKSE